MESLNASINRQKETVNDGRLNTHCPGQGHPGAPPCSREQRKDAHGAPSSPAALTHLPAPRHLNLECASFNPAHWKNFR